MHRTPPASDGDELNINDRPAENNNIGRGTMKNRWPRASALVGAITLVVTGCATGFSGVSTAGASSAPPLRFFLEAPLSTQYLKTNAATIVQASKAAVTVINKQGGVLGQKVVLAVTNTDSSP